MGYNAVVVQAPGLVGHCVRCFLDVDRQDFVARRGLDMRVVAVERERAFGDPDVNVVRVGLNILGSFQKGLRQAVSTAIAEGDDASVSMRSLGEEMGLSVVATTHA